MFQRYLPLVEAEMARALNACADSPMFQMIRYHLGLDSPETETKGKRLRPVLCLLVCEGLGGEAELAAPAAVGIEFAHAFTLLHDDIADQDNLRRGRPTVWRQWGVGQALTAGDALYALANLCFADLDADRLGLEVSAACWRELNQAVLEVCQGQQFDISFEGRGDVSVDDYLQMVELKTGRLLSATAAVGALIAGANETVVEACRRFGRELGVGFQIRDDVLGIWGEAERTGKPVGGDLMRRKRSLPVIHALSTAGPESDLGRRLTHGVSTREEAAAAAAEMESLGGRGYCEQMAEESLRRALAELSAVAPRAPQAGWLRTLAGFLVSRTR